MTREWDIDQEVKRIMEQRAKGLAGPDAAERLQWLHAERAALMRPVRNRGRGE